MKAEERHKLKSNELAETIKGLPEYWHEHGSKILLWASVIIIVLAGGLWWRNAQLTAAQAQRDQLLSLVVQKSALQFQASQEAQDGSQGDFGGIGGPQISSLIGPLGALAQDTAGSGMAATALLQQAEAIRAEWLVSNQMIGAERKTQLCQQAADIYQKVLSHHADDPIAAGSANMGLALVAEDTGDWDRAKDIYQQIISQADDKLAGTVYPKIARQRLAMLDDISEPIEFPMVSTAPAQTPASETEDAPGAGTVLAPPTTPEDPPTNN